MMDEIIRLLIRNRDRIGLPWKPMEQRKSTSLSASLDRVVQLGARMPFQGMDADAVFWCASHMTIFPVSMGRDLFSFEFSGCVMARFVANGCDFGAHIHTDRESRADCKDIAIDYMLQQQASRIAIFRPDFDLRDSLDPHWECWGVISRTRRCYTVVCDLNDDDSYNLKYIREHEPSVQVAELLRHGTPEEPTGQLWEKSWKAERKTDWFDYRKGPPGLFGINMGWCRIG